VKILFLTANPVDVVIRLRIDQEIREISQKIRKGTFRDHLELASECAVRPDDLQDALLRHQPDIVHFSGHFNQTGEILLEDEAGLRKVVTRKALSDLFTILKDNVQMVVLNACYGKDQAQALTNTIDFAIGINAALEDKAAIVFSAHFYQSLAFGRSVKEAYDLAVNELAIEGIVATELPELLVRDGANASESRIVKPSRPVAFLPWLFTSLAMILTTDILRRFLGGEGGWSDIAAAILQPVLFAFSTIAAVLTVTSLVLPANRFVEKAASLGVFSKPDKPRRKTVLAGIAFIISLGLWLSLPAFARYFNERGAGFQYREQPDLSGARESYEQAVRLKPGYAQAHYNLALIYEELQPDKAIEEYLLAIKYDSQIYPAYNNLARLYLLRGKDNDYENALNILSRAGDLSPGDENAQYSLNKNLGWASYALKRYPMAEMYLRRAISLRIDQSAAAHCLLAYVLKEQGKAGVADECFDCVSLAPGEKDLEAKWLSDAQECLMKGDGK
jgi:tetratricopeptide (TPR) repeat protein